MLRYLSDKDGDLSESIQKVLYSKRLPIIVVTFLQNSSPRFPPPPRGIYCAHGKDFVFEKAGKPRSKNIVHHLVLRLMLRVQFFSISKTSA